jgi:cytochrome c553
MRAFHLLVCGLLFGGILALARPAQAADAAQNYHDFCTKCHGDEGKGNGPSAATLNPKPRDYTDCKVMQNKKDDELIKAITEGGESVGMSADMQPWGGTLSAEEIRDLLKLVRGFCKQP